VTLVSVVVPTYNRADALPATVESVLAQTHEELEVLVVDDASTDDTPAVMADYDDPRLEYLRLPENRGGSAARNRGIEAADGEYVAFLDSDDRWRPTKLERQLSLLRSRGNDWIAAYCDVTRPADGDTGRLEWLLGRALGGEEPRRREGGEELIEEVLTDRLHTSAGSTLLVEREVATAIGGFDESFERFQDTEFLVRVLERGKLAHLPEELVLRDPAGHPSAETTERALQRVRASFADHVERLEANGEDVTGAQHLILAKEYLAEGELATGFDYARSAAPETTQVPGLVAATTKGVGRRLRSLPSA
jgi:GT2 family glycosyltransferase